MGSAPTPLGPYSLCALMDMRSTFISSTLTGTLPTACAASVWKNTLRARHIAPISSIGWMTPGRGSVHTWARAVQSQVQQCLLQEGYKQSK